MACLWLNQNETNIEVPSTQEIEGVTYYNILVRVGDIKWKLKHRYSDFFYLHNQLIAEHGISKDILPAKKAIRNKSSTFIESRRKGLEEYLQKALVFLQRTMPRIFIEFLNFHLYDIYFLLQDLSVKCFKEADTILSSDKSYSFRPLELHAVSEFLRKPFPVLDNTENPVDPSPILELCSQLETVTVEGGSENYLESNIILNKLPFEFSSFKALKSLFLKNVALDMIYFLGNLRNTVIKLKVSDTSARSISQILQCDVLHKNTLEGSEKWKALDTLDLSNNSLIEIDESICLAKSIAYLTLSNNKITSISNLTHLPNLSYLDLTNNLITNCDQLHTKVGNILVLTLSQNGITSTRDFGKLYSLETLDLSCNKITEISEIRYLGNLPCLENLILTGNPVSANVDYRIHVFEFFGNRAKYICLDNEKPSQSELDKVSVLSAIRIVKEGKTPDLAVNKFVCD